MADKKRRIHDLAKDLEVESKTIISKCNAEGISVKNHMHVLSAGLEATIRGWFSGGVQQTALEEAATVDMDKVRVKRKRATKKAGELAHTGESEDQSAVATVTAEPPDEHADEEAPSYAPSEEPSLAPAAEFPEPMDPAAEAPDEPIAEPPVTPQGVPSVSEQVSAAGPQNVPRPAQLAGPKVVRMDKPEFIDRPRPAARTGPRAPISRLPFSPPRDDAAAKDLTRPGVRVPKREGEATETPAAKRHPRRTSRDNAQSVEEQFKEWRERDILEMRERMAAASGTGISRLRAIEKKGGPRGSQPALRAKKTRVELVEPIRAGDFARETGINMKIVSRHLDTFAVTVNQVIPTDKAEVIAAEYGIELVALKPKTGLDLLNEEFNARERKRLQQRPPVVTVLGHVDHGKTSLLDRIRQTDVAADEAGGITQHIGAYRVQVGEKWVTFLDTPGHAAFTAMRARGANLTDVVVLVVAADDGVMPTTIEAINHARAANTTIVVALNKIDLPHDINKIYSKLAEQNLTPAEWGGQTDVVKTSATTGEGIDTLLNHLATLSDVLDLKADPSLAATGSVIETKRDEKIGNVVRVLVREGTLKEGQIVVCGPGHGRVRALKDDRGRRVSSAGPSTPVEVLGLSEIPSAGDRFFVVENAKRAQEIANDEANRRRAVELVRTAKPTTLDTIFADAAEGEIPELNVIIRADAQGSIDALRQELSGFPDDEVRLNILHAGIGTVTESDLSLAEASSAIIIAFYVSPDPSVAREADILGIDIRSYRVLYEVSDDIRKALEGLLEPEQKQEQRGRADVRQVFAISKVGKIAGCFVRDGIINRNHKVRVIRDGVVVKEGGSLDSLKRFKDDAKEVKAGVECGIRIERFDDLKPGDVIEAYEVVKIARTLAASKS